MKKLLFYFTTWYTLMYVTEKHGAYNVTENKIIKILLIN